jgi:membrane fusion protein (multidrug efflux system)
MLPAKKKKLLPLFFLLIIVALGVFIYWFIIGRFIESTDNAYVKSDMVQISPKIAGYISEVKVLQNQEVKAGDVLVVIDKQDFAPKVAEAEADLSLQQATIEKFKKQIEMQEDVIDKSKSAIEFAKADLSKTEKEFKRSKALLKEGVISKEKFEAAEADYIKAKSNYDQAKSFYKSNLRQNEVYNAGLKEQKEKVKEGSAKLELANNDLENIYIKSPADGFVGNKSAQVGAYVRPATPLLTIIPKGSTYIEANFKETQLKRMKVGQKVRIEIDAIPGHEFKGTIQSFSPGSGAIFSLLPPENATGNFSKIVQRIPVKITIDADEFSEKIIPGLSAVIKINTK